MRWLEWSTIDLSKGLGGVEVHARSLARELEKKGIEVSFSSRLSDLKDPRWDVVHTHGSAPGPQGLKSAVRVHTLHGTTLGRMAACSEWTWPGGYAAALRELNGVKNADVVLAVHSSLWLYRHAQKLGKTCAVCWNGWDSYREVGLSESLSAELRQRLEKLEPFWIYVGRGGDRVKAVERLHGAMNLLQDMKWVAAPGDGFENRENVLKTGPLSSEQIREVMKMASGLVLCSKYEGNPLVVLEALAQGTPVVATKVGAVPELFEKVQGRTQGGLIIADASNAQSIADAIRFAGRFDLSETARAARGMANQSALPSWADVAEISIRAVQDFESHREN